MSSPEVRLIDPTESNARRVIELTRYVYEHKVHDGLPLYTTEALDQIANPSDEEAVQAKLRALETQGNDSELKHHYYGIFDTDRVLQAFLKGAIWDADDEGFFWKGIPPASEYYSETNPVFGSHDIAVSGMVRGLGFGKRLFDRMISERPNSTIKTAVNEKDAYLQNYMVEVRGMTRTDKLGMVEIGGRPDLATEHRMFFADISDDGKVI